LPLSEPVLSYTYSREVPMRQWLILVLMLAATPFALSATEVTVPSPAPANVVQNVPQTTLVQTEIVQVPVRAEQVRFDEDAAAAMQPNRTYWWWIVAAVVVGGIILAIL
jgi:hypothetical protein